MYRRTRTWCPQSKRSSGDFWGYNPSKMIVHTEVAACVDGNKLVIARPDGKQYKPTMIRRERN